MNLLTPHFHLEEFLFSQEAARRGISNVPDVRSLTNIEDILAPGMERVRLALDELPILVSSGYRSERLNRAVGGSPNSDHVKGLAADFTCPAFGAPRAVALHLQTQATAVGFAQLIYEGTWVHISFPPPGGAARGDVLTAHFAPGRATVYTRGIA